LYTGKKKATIIILFRGREGRERRGKGQKEEEDSQIVDSCLKREAKGKKKGKPRRI